MCRFKMEPPRDRRLCPRTSLLYHACQSERGPSALCTLFKVPRRPRCNVPAESQMSSTKASRRTSATLMTRRRPCPSTAGALQCATAKAPAKVPAERRARPDSSPADGSPAEAAPKKSGRPRLAVVVVVVASSGEAGVAEAAAVENCGGTTSKVRVVPGVAHV